MILMINFWQTLRARRKPITVLAPMEEVPDASLSEKDNFQFSLSVVALLPLSLSVRNLLCLASLRQLINLKHT